MKTIHRAALTLSLALCACAPERPSDTKLERGGPNSEQRPSEADRRPVAIIDGEKITVDEFERRLSGMAPYARVRYNTLEKKQELLNTMVAFELLARDARERGYEDDPAVLHAMKDTMVRRMLDDELRKRVTPADISQGDVERAYRERQSRYARPAQRRAALIAVDSREILDAILGKLSKVEATDTKERVKTFRMLSSRYHRLSEVAARGGDVGFFSPLDTLKKGGEELSPSDRALTRALFSLEEVGEISDPYEVDGVWHVALFLEEKSASSRPLSQATAELRQHLYEKRKHEAREALIKEMRSRAKVEINQGVLESIDPPEPSMSLEDLRYGSTPTRDLRRDEVMTDTPRTE